MSLKELLIDTVNDEPLIDIDKACDLYLEDARIVVLGAAKSISDMAAVSIDSGEYIGKVYCDMHYQVSCLIDLAAGIGELQRAVICAKLKKEMTNER